MKYSSVKLDQQYQVQYFWQPGKWMGAQDLTELHQNIIFINQNGPHLDYGILKPNANSEFLKQFYDQAIICIMYLEKKPVGFFYNMIINETFKPFPILHAGLVVVNQNNGKDLLSIPYNLCHALTWLSSGTHYVTNISHVPAIVGIFSDLYSHVWPHYKKKTARPKRYKEVMQELVDQYVIPFFPETEKIKVDMRRFVLEGYEEREQMSFEKNLRKLSPHSNMLTNLFCMYWLDYQRGDDLVQVGVLDWKFFFKTLPYTFFKLLKVKKTSYQELLYSTKTQLDKPLKKPLVTNVTEPILVPTLSADIQEETPEMR